MVIIYSRLHAVRRPYLTSTKGIVAASAYKQTIIESRGQSRPAAIASLTACAKTRSASNLASSLQAIDSTTGERARRTVEDFCTAIRLCSESACLWEQANEIGRAHV